VNRFPDSSLSLVRQGKPGQYCGGGKHNLGSGPQRESDRPIVVRKRGSARGAKGPDRERVSVDKEGRCTVNGVTEYVPVVYATLAKCGVREG